MGYKIEYRKQPLKYLDKQPHKCRARIIAAINKLPTEGAIAPMEGRPGFRLRIGEHRVLFNTDHNSKTVTIEAIGSRGDVYK
ncbi:MAG: type II toxin-antitoxin system RelE/ParE family toxin [Oscillospiraceae bacterium]|jgi:mRNA interferase RelE/StbE|nr:type II toxin-antitoxin system RelE/ParE family toxin [Oscillospiraceae bacterium]